MALTDTLIKDGWLKSPEIISAFRKINRADFMPEGLKDMAELNEAIPIGFGQTISQPLTVALMIEQLKPEKGDSILDIGSGSGYTTSLLAELAGESGKVIGVELIPDLTDFGRHNAEKYGFVSAGRADFITADGFFGYSKSSPYNRILASASAEEIPGAWKEQLKIGGRIVAPVGNSIVVLKKKGENVFEKDEFPGFIFVPLVLGKD